MARLIILAMPLIALAGPVFAQQAATDAKVATAEAAPAPTPVAPAKPDKICRTVPVTGQRMMQKKCYTAAQWADLDGTNDQAAKKFIGDVTGAAAKANIGGANTMSLFGLGPSQ